MAKLPNLTGEELIAALQKVGFCVVSQNYDFNSNI